MTILKMLDWEAIGVCVAVLLIYLLGYLSCSINRDERDQRREKEELITENELLKELLEIEEF